MSTSRLSFWPQKCLITFAAAILVFSGCTRTNHPQAYKFGVILPLTGSGAEWGQSCKKGIDLALADINSAGGISGKQVNLIYEDSQTDANHAVSALRKLIDVENVPACIVDMISSNVLAMAPIANENKVVILSPGASAPELADAGPYVFRNWPSDSLQGTVGADFAAQQLKWKSAGIFYINNSFGSGLKKAFTSRFQHLGGKITFTDSFEKGVTDVRPQVAKLKHASMDGLFLLGYPAEFPVVLRQIREAGVQVRILSTLEFEEPNILKSAGSAAEGVVFSALAPVKTKASQAFLSEYKAKYHADPGVTADAGYDALTMLVHCTKSVGYSGQEIQKCLTGLKGYNGASGIVTFTPDRSILKPYVFKVVRNGRFVLYSNKIYGE